MRTVPAAEVQQVRADILSHGALTVKAEPYIQRNVKRYGAKRKLRRSDTVAGRIAAKAGKPQPKSTVVQVGEAPDGFGKQVLWDEADAGLALLVFLNAADPYGVMISGAKPTDSIQFIHSEGIASFSTETENEGAGALITFVAAGATAGAAAFGAPEAAPLINAGAAFAKDRFKEKEVKTKRRDPFGEDPGTGHKARQEGGVIISMPEAQGMVYSGNNDHEERWIKEPGTRDNSHRPNHVRNAYFLNKQSTNRNRRKALAAGDFVICAWDHEFEDNVGFYRLHCIVKRGNGRPPKPRTPDPVE